MKKWALLISLFVLIASGYGYAADLSAGDGAVIEKAGIPLYPEADFVYGNKELGYRFASKVPPEEVRKWYREKLPGWSVNDEFGSWIMFDGKAGADMGTIMSTNQILIIKNEKLPEWHSLGGDMTTEITIMVMKPQ